MIPIQQALSAGYSEEDVLDFIQKAIPKLGTRIKQARNAGYQTSNLLNFLSKTMEGEEYPEYYTQAQIQKAQREKTNRMTQQFLKSSALGAGIGAVAGKAIKAGLPKIAEMFAKPKVAGVAEQAAAPVSEALKGISREEAKNIQEALGPNLVPRVESLSTYNAPEAIPGILNFLVSDETKKKIESQTKKPFNQVVKEYGEYYLKTAKERPLSIESLTKQFEEGYVPEEKDVGFKDAFGSLKGGGITSQLYEGIFKALQEGKKTYSGVRDPLMIKAEPLFKQGLIKSPEDIKKLQEGKLDVSKGQPILQQSKNQGKKVEQTQEEKAPIERPEALGEVQPKTKIPGLSPDAHISGEMSKVLEEFKDPEDAAVLALELIKSFTPEEMRSTHHAMNYYDPDDHTGYFVFHNGAGYIVNDLSPDEYSKLSNEVVAARTTGKDIWGEWAAGEGSRGAAYNQIVKEGKKPYKKLQMGYNIFSEFQKNLASARKKKKKKRGLYEV